MRNELVNFDIPHDISFLNQYRLSEKNIQFGIKYLK